jgi:murein DD-endopeptidase / murein LD-carboxypeptidase
LREELARCFRKVPKRTLRPGDVMLLQAGEEQPHLAVRTDRGFIHAHAGIRRVVETPGLPEWPLLDVYRKLSR